jgi:hypothetical protein
MPAHQPDASRQETPHGDRSGTTPTGTCRLIGGLVLGAAIAACAPNADTSSGRVTVRDSAGVQIVEHDAAAVAALPVWTIDTSPELELATTDDDAFTAIGDLQPWTDGRLVVADRRHRDVREYAVDGTFTRVLARSGQGPGEVSFVSRLQRLPGDTLVVLDGNARRASFFDASGAYRDEVAYPRFTDGAPLRISARLHDGHWLGTIRAPWIPPAQPDGRIRRDTFAIVQLVLHDSVGPRIDTVALVPDGETFDVTVTYDGEPSPDVESLRLGRATFLATDGDQLAIGTNESFELRIYRDARLRRLIRLDVPVEPAPSDAGARVIAWVKQGLVGRPPEVLAEFEALSRNWRFATTLPFHEALRWGEDGTLWASAATVLPTDARRFLVFDSTGRALARVELPPRVEPFRMTRETILGTWLDADDVPHVRRWRLRAAP